MQSLNHDFNEKHLERYLTLAWQSGAAPVVVFTKADLVTDYHEYMKTAERIAPGVEAFAGVEQYLGKCKFRDCRHQTEPVE